MPVCQGKFRIIDRNFVEIKERGIQKEKFDILEKKEGCQWTGVPKEIDK